MSQNSVKVFAEKKEELEKWYADVLEVCCYCDDDDVVVVVAVVTVVVVVVVVSSGGGVLTPFFCFSLSFSFFCCSTVFPSLFDFV